MISFLKNIFSPKNEEFHFTAEDAEFYKSEGYLTLKNVFDETALQKLEAEIDSIWENRKSTESPYILDFCEGPYNDQRMKLSDAPDDARQYSHKLNDYFLESEQCRNICLYPPLADALEKLLGEAPAIINSLNFKKGSQQDDHFDTYFMPPPTPGRMVVTSICLEDIKPDSGPVRYFPKSHLIEPCRLAHGGIHVTNPEEREQVREYIDQKLEEAGIGSEIYLGKRGDVLVWHGQLYHGGTPITNPNSTRKTLVTHYWGASDVPEAQRINHAPNSYYFKRPHPPLPEGYSSDIKPDA
ncbi:phytanoyl-CoA dioxygenase family protein [Puniceicoccaceae bacterium K14]|nr:phytanoyl-CoA dioxygenase family protein [Puniceicoccaceae bacterium K14]